jgi:hypothetical protein
VVIENVFLILDFTLIDVVSVCKYIESIKFKKNPLDKKLFSLYVLTTKTSEFLSSSLTTLNTFKNQSNNRNNKLPKC